VAGATPTGRELAVPGPGLVWGRRSHTAPERMLKAACAAAGLGKGSHDCLTSCSLGYDGWHPLGTSDLPSDLVGGSFSHGAVTLRP
jgi:hypothetical protein